MTWTVTVDGGGREVVLPNGLRYQGAAQAVLSDAWYGRLSAEALDSLLTAEYLGGDASYEVTLADGTSGVALPDGLLHKAGDVVTLSDEQYSILSPAAVEGLLSSVSVTVTA
jgi:hypothetical protein